MNKVKKVLKIFLLSTLVIVVGSVIFAFSFYFVVTSGTKLDKTKLVQAQSNNVSIIDTNGNSIASLSNKNYIEYESLKQHTIDAFVAAEDKRFFSHHGVDYIRIFGAIKNNIIHPKHKQGGSTITQQVIKNTQLSNEKTLARKLKEIKLAKELEKTLSKKQILQTYLNSIYFGNGCYGIENASKYYFDKDASELSVSESALLASTINAPSIYDPVSNLDKAISRRNLILKLMQQYGKISNNEYDNAINTYPEIVKKSLKNINQYSKGAIAEACKILHVSENQLKNLNVKIETFYDSKIQNKIEELIKSNNLPSMANQACIILDNKNKAVVALAGQTKSDILSNRRQPGSLVKPLLVYAPAFETGKYAPASFVEDAPIDISGYTPENYDKKYRGYVSVRQAIANSLNIPAVKVFQDIGITYSTNFSRKLGLSFEKEDNNLALALGGFTTGLTIKELADAYMSLSSNGQFSRSQFVKSIRNDNKLIYERKLFTNRVMKESTAYLITDCLKDVARYGTAKRLSVNFPVASKTGTVGNKNGNTDAYNVSYTSEHTILTWMGTNDNTNYLPKNFTGATYPTLFNSKVLNLIYANHKPYDFEKPSSIKAIPLSTEMLNEHTLSRDDSSNKFEVFDENFMIPECNSRNFQISIDNFENRKPIIKFYAKREYLYQIYRISCGNLQFLQNYQFVSGDITFEDLSAKSGDVYEYFVVEKNNYNSQESNHIKLIVQ